MTPLLDRYGFSVGRLRDNPRMSETEPYPPAQKDPKPEENRQEVGPIHQRDRLRIAGGDVVDADVKQLEKEGEHDREKNTFQLSATVEFSWQKAGERD